MPVEDLINEGNLGLIEVAGRFDATRGTKFTTYAARETYPITRQAIANVPEPLKA